jgi:predicted esterase
MLNKSRFKTIIFVLSLFTFACNNPEPKKENTEPVVTTSQPEFTAGAKLKHSTPESGSYTLYIPQSYSQEKKFSVLILLDPHGKGDYPVDKYKGLADKFGLVLMGSNDSKNGIQIEECVRIVQRLIDECKRLSFFDGNVSIAGFSGGAKVALVAGNTIPKFNSIIYCGAALPPRSIELKTPLLGIAGKKDMNYTEVKGFYNWASSQIPYNGIVEWNGKHEWPDSAAFQRAFYWHRLNCSLSKNDPVIADYIEFIDKLSSKESNPLRKAEMLSNRAAVLEHFQSTKEYKNAIRKIILSREYQTAKADEAKMFAIEDNRKNELVSSFTTRDLSWWNNTIKQLQSAKNNQSDQRLLGYISLASWSYSSKAIEQNDFPIALKSLEIYQMADPENSEHEFLRACLYAKINRPDSAVYYLKEAVKLGLDDRSKVDNDKNLAPLHGRSDYNEVIAMLKYNP